MAMFSPHHHPLTTVLWTCIKLDCRICAAAGVALSCTNMKGYDLKHSIYMQILEEHQLTQGYINSKT